MFYQWGAVILPLGYTDDTVHAAGGYLYGTSWLAGFPSTMRAQTVLDCARDLDPRLTRFAEVLAEARAEVVEAAA